MEHLLQELHLVSELAPTGSHSKVAEENHISLQYLWEIRKGKNMKSDTPENRKTMSNLIISYRRIIEKYKRELNKI